MRHRSFDVNPAEYPFESRWHDRAEGTMHYVDEGEGPAIVMCHGNPTWSYLYRHIIKAMRGDTRCIAHDLPGFGYSPIPDGHFGFTVQEHVQWLESLLFERLKLQHFVLVVQDWGGPIGLDIASRHPERIRGIVISSTWAWPVPPAIRLFSHAFGNPLLHEANLRFNLFPRWLMKATLGRNARTDSTLSAYISPFPDRDSRAAMAALPCELRDADPWLAALERRLSTLRHIPVEFIFGARDILSRPRYRERWHRHFPNAVTHVDPQAGHYTQEDCPQHYVAALRRVLALS